MVWLAPKAGCNGRPPVFSDAAVQFCLTVKVLFGLPLRQTTGMVASILSMAGLDWPCPGLLDPEPQAKDHGGADHAAPRSGPTEPACRYRAMGTPLVRVTRAKGIKFLGDGEWLARKHGTHRRRQYRKVHLAMDMATGDIRAVEFTSRTRATAPFCHTR